MTSAKSIFCSSVITFVFIYPHKGITYLSKHILLLLIPYYTIFDVIDGKVTNVSKMASPEGCGCKSGIAPVLRQMGVVVMLAGNMGQGAKNVLEAQRIEVIRGCSGDIEELVAAYLAGNVKDNGEACDHHDCH